jgi:hypothetical protein
VIVRKAEQIEPGPRQLLGYKPWRTHVGATTLLGTRHRKVMNLRLEVRECDVGLADDIKHLIDSGQADR